MGQPEWIRTLQCHEIGEISALSQEENRIGGPVPRKYHTL